MANQIVNQFLNRAKIFTVLFIAILVAQFSSTNIVDAKQASTKTTTSVKKALSGTKVAPPAAQKPVTLIPASAKLKAGSKEFLWKATSDSGATVFLVGTIHAVQPNFYPLPEEFDKALAKSKALIVEIDTTKLNPEATKQLAITKGLYPNGDSMVNHVSAETISELQRMCTSPELPFQGIVRMRPWLAALSLVTLEMQKQGHNMKQAIDLYLIKNAHNTGKKVIALETEEFQIGIFSGFSADLQEKMLQLTFHDLKDLKEHLLELDNAWKKGDEKEMNTFITKDLDEHPEFIPVQEKMIYERNVTMAEKIEGYLKGNDTYMVAVGSAHMVGDRGICELLRKKGYKVEQVLAGDTI